MLNQTKRESGFPFGSLLFSISLLMLAATVGGFFALQYFIGRDEQKLVELTASLAKQKSQDERNLEKKVLAYRRMLNDFPDLLNEHRMPTAMLAKLEEMTFSEVYFTKMKLDPLVGTLEISGISRNFAGLSRQLEIFRAVSGVFSGVSLNQAALNDKGTVDFVFNTKVDPEVMAFKQ